MSHRTTRGISSPSGRRPGRISVGVDPPVSHSLASSAEKPHEDAILGVSDTGLKIRVSLVQWRSWSRHNPRRSWIPRRNSRSRAAQLPRHPRRVRPRFARAA
jgi:hypothetical protein